MNRLLYVARKAKGLTEIQLAKVLKIEEREYIALEHSLTDVDAKQALILAKLFNIDAEQFIYTEGSKERQAKYVMDEITKYKENGLLNNISPAGYFHIVDLGNTALRLAAELNHALYRQYELEKDNEAIRKLNATLSESNNIVVE